MKKLMDFDKKYLWHPYTSMIKPLKTYFVKKAKGVYLYLNDNTKIIDGMSSWWCAIHGYNNPVLNKALNNQVLDISHVMFGGITHKPAIELGQKLIKILPKGLEHIFYCDSGSVSVEVAMKMALQYWFAKGQKKKKKFITITKGYHGDTTGAMSVCDPINGMHNMFESVISKNIFVDAPVVKFKEKDVKKDILKFKEKLIKNKDKIAACILEPVVQGAGGMRVYSKYYLKEVADLCKKNNVLLIADEIATGFGRTGKMFACEYAKVVPDIMCIGKALTAGYMSFAAVITSKKIAKGISSKGNVFMHGPTFMANALACSIASACIDLLYKNNWQKQVLNIEKILIEEFKECKSYKHVKDIRVIGAIGVIELNRDVDVEKFQKECVKRGVWIRPFRNLIYIMPPYIIKKNQLLTLTNSIKELIQKDLF